MTKSNRVVVTGMGVLAPNGTGLKAFWRSLVAGESGIGPITLFDASGFKSRIAGEVKGFDPLDYMPADWKPKRMARHTQLAYAAAKMALKDANYDASTQTKDSILPVIIGVSTSALDVIERVFHPVSKHQPRQVGPSELGASTPQAPANFIADRIGASAHGATLSSACPSGLDAIAVAAAMIRRGEAEIAIAGGADAPVTPLAMASFASAGLSSFAHSDDASHASRPYDRKGDSGVISEGAGIVVLESWEHAAARGVRSYLAIEGYCTQKDSDPLDPCGGLECTMRLALANACRSVRQVDYICSYGPGHPALDAAEVLMIRRVFGDRAPLVPVSSIKGVTGNPLAAAGPMQIISCALAFRHNLIPPTANHEEPQEACDLDFVPRRARKGQLNCALVNVRGLGGGNSSMVLGKAATE